MLLHGAIVLALVSHLAQSINASPMDKDTNIPIRRGLAGWGYATFYTDHACTQGAGQAVSMGNAGCLANEYGRNSIYVQPGANSVARAVSLVWSPAKNCNCQNDCASVANNGNNNYCWDLNGHAAAESFRFITQGCSNNNC